MKDFKEFLTEERRTDKIGKLQKLFDAGFEGTQFTTNVGDMDGTHSFELKKGAKDCGEVSSMRIMGKQSTYVLLNGLSKVDCNKILKVAEGIFGKMGMKPSNKEEGTWGIKQYFAK